MRDLTPKHRADKPVRLTPLHSYRPRHCAGASTCLHLHPEDRRCHCRQVVLPAGVGTFLTSVKPVMSTQRQVPLAHTLEGCHIVSAASVGLRKAGA